MSSSMEALGESLHGWKTIHSPMTDAQRVDLDMLAAEAGEGAPDDNLSQAQASEIIKKLRHEVGAHEEDTDTVIGDDEDE